MNLLARLRAQAPVEDNWPPLSFADWAQMFAFNGEFGLPYYMVGGGTRETQIGRDYVQLARFAFERNPIVFACMDVRRRVFSDARFTFRRLLDSRPSGYFGTADLGVLEHPWPGATTSDLLSYSLQHADLAGNAFLWRPRGADWIRPLRPDWVTIAIGTDQSADELEQGAAVQGDLLGYIFQPGGETSGKDPIFIPAEEIGHFAPIPDPEATYKGISWLHPIIRDIVGDNATTTHKLSYFERGGAPSFVVTFKNPMKDERQFEAKVKAFRERHEGPQNAYKTMFLGAGADITTVGSDLRQLDFAITQRAGEVRICAAAGVPPMMISLEGMDKPGHGFAEVRRYFADSTIRYLWRQIAGAVERIVPAPGGNTELWIDDRDNQFVQEDQQDAALVVQTQAATINTLITAGFSPESAVNAVTTGDLTQLQHTGLVSVQLLRPGGANEGDGPSQNQNGKAPPPSQEQNGNQPRNGKPARQAALAAIGAGEEEE